MPDTRWFAGVTVNYADALLAGRGAPEDAAAIIATNEAAEDRVISRAELRLGVGRAAAALARDGIGAGDTVAAFVANVPEAVVLHLACAARGAIFSSCSPDFGADAAYARFHQIAPKLLLASSSYPYNGKRFDTGTVVADLAARLPGIAARRRPRRRHRRPRRRGLGRLAARRVRRRSPRSRCPSITRSRCSIRPARPACPRRWSIAPAACC